jgi:hypothetical protein
VSAFSINLLLSISKHPPILCNVAAPRFFRTLDLLGIQDPSGRVAAAGRTLQKESTAFLTELLHVFNCFPSLHTPFGGFWARRVKKRPQDYLSEQLVLFGRVWLRKKLDSAKKGSERENLPPKAEFG